jgi:hypothetical protein
MKKVFNLKVFTLLAFALCVVVISCDDDVEVANTNALNPSIFFENKAQLESASAALYAHLQTPGLYQRYGYILPDTFSDEMRPSGDPNFLPSYRFTLDASLVQTSDYWAQCYNGIAKSNFILDNEEKIRGNSLISTSGFSEQDADNALGEAYFMRALHYWLLARRYGGVPLRVTQSVEGLPRSTEDETYALIIDDFDKASQLLFSKEATDEGRATQGAAYGMLGKVLLFRGRNAEAQTALSNVTGYSLLPEDQYKDNFNESGEFNDESMFEVVFSGDNNPSDTWAGNGQGIAEVTFHAQEYSGWGNARPSQKMIDEFETDDPRKAIAILEDGDAYGPGDAFTNTNGTIWYKFSQLYENETIVPEGSTNVRFLRYADVVLMKAEIEHNLGNDPVAINFLNELRNRFNLPEYGSAEMDARGYPVNTPNNVFKAIVHERMVELCAEQHRFDDLVRWNLDAQELEIDFEGNPRNYNPNVHRYMPIPQKEIDINSILGSGEVAAQNTGY